MFGVHCVKSFFAARGRTRLPGNGAFTPGLGRLFALLFRHRSVVGITNEEVELFFTELNGSASFLGATDGERAFCAGFLIAPAST